MKTGLSQQFLFLLFLSLIPVLSGCGKNVNGDNGDKKEEPQYITYYVDSQAGDDNNKGTSESDPWKSLSKVEATVLNGGDTVKLKRGSDFSGHLFINYSGAADRYITIKDYGIKTDPAPKLTNPVFEQDDFGNCIRVNGSYVIIENLYFHSTVPFVPGVYETGGGWVVWEMGAIHLARGAENCIVRNNEMFDCVAGIRSYGKNALIENNYIHDCARPMREWNWGPIGIWLGADSQMVRGNTIVNMQVVDPDMSHFTNGIGGGAFEIDDGRYPKSNISIVGNFTRGNAGFLETVFNDVVPNPVYKDWNISFNVSDDFQAFVKLRFASNCSVDNNTIIRRKVNANELGVFVLKGTNTANKFRNNIIVTKYNVQVFNVVGNKLPGSIIENNLYHAIGPLVMGGEGPGLSPYYGDPLFTNFTGTQAVDFFIQENSPAKNAGKLIGYTHDYTGTAVPAGGAPDIGAFEIK